MVNYTECHGDVQKWTETYAAFSYIVNGILTTLCVAAGSIGNITSIKAVHFSNFDKNRGVVLAVSLLALAIWDTLLLWCAFFYFGIKRVTKIPYSDTLNLLTPFFHGFSQISNTASVWCMISITVQRYMATRDPFRTTRHSKVPVLTSFRTADRRKTSLGFIYCSQYRRHFRIPLFISLAAALVNVPAFFEIVARLCYRKNEGRLGYGLFITDLRLNKYYKLYYKVIFRMLVTSCFPNIFILLLTVLTIRLLRGSNRSRRQLFQMSESLLDRYNSKETMQTMVSLMLVIKFLVFRSPAFALDLWEAFGYQKHFSQYIYVVDISNFLFLLNSATNCLIFLRGSTWIQSKIIQRNTMKRKKQLCIENLQSMRRVNLLFKSWQHALFMTNRQFGVRVLYAMLIKNPSMASYFNITMHSNAANSENPPCPPPTPACPMEVRASANGSFGSITTTSVHQHVLPVVNLSRAHTLGSDNPSGVKARTAEIVAALPHFKKRSLEVLGNPLFHDVGDRIMAFIGSLIDSMRSGHTDQQIIATIRRCGILHQQVGIVFSSSVWKEFKATSLVIFGECAYASDTEKSETLDAWSSFLSVIIREMKFGISATAAKTKTSSSS